MGSSVNVNKTTQSVFIGGKEKVPLAPKTVPQAERQFGDGVNRETVDCETPQVQNRVTATRTVREMSYDSSSRTDTGRDTGSASGVATGEVPITNPLSEWSAAGHEGISSAVRIKGLVLELARKVHNHPVKVLIDSGATGNFISDNVVNSLQLKVVPEA